MEWMKEGMEGNGDRNLQNNFRKLSQEGELRNSVLYQRGNIRTYLYL